MSSDEKAAVVSSIRADAVAPTLDRSAVQQVSEERERITALFVSIDKAVKGIRLYKGEGSLVERMMDDVEQKAQVALAHGPLTVRVASFGLVYGGWPINVDERRVPYLFQLFCDGVRELSILEGVDRAELRNLILVLSSESKGQEDMVTALWQRNLPHVRYYAADTFAAGMEVGEDGEMTLASTRSQARLDAVMGTKEITLSPDDIRMLAGEGQLEWVKDVAVQLRAAGRVAAMAARIRESFQTPMDIRRFVALGIRVAAATGAGPSPMVLDVFEALVASARALEVAEILGAILDVAERASQGGGDASLVAAAQGLASAVGLSDRMRRVAPLVEKDPERFIPLLRRLAGRAREGLVAVLTELPTGPAQSQLHVILLEAGVDLTAYYSRVLTDDRDDVVVHAIQALGDIGTPDAIKALSQALARNSTPVRKAALEAMVGKYTPEARVGLARALRDPVQENRLLALKVVSGSGDTRVAWGLMASVQDAAFAQKDAAEQAAFLSALASFRDPRIMALFQEILSRKNVMRTRAVISLQVQAAKALGEAATEEGRKVLEEFRDFKAHPREVHQAIEDALAASRKR